ncbi:MAG: 2-C-methyl-D-erythritol 4-phosphate cytidylyltransferase [Eubacterium sp.]|nr:2-C-methyl-D-erythritol 4-phosphate cytidylyltransferase [Eubacterium sp.]
MSKITAIVLAAGSGSRMNSDTKKQYMEINGKPVVWYSLNAFENSRVDEIILVVPEGEREYATENFVEKYGFKKVAMVITGGAHRYDSVYHGLEHTTGDYVLIHDAARPMITNDIIDRCIDGAMEYKACVAGMPVKDTIKEVNEDKVVVNTPARETLYITQTPQAFEYDLVHNSYIKLFGSGDQNVTDDAMVVEQFGRTKVKFVEGSYENIKITTPEDVEIAKTLLTLK